MDKQRPPAQMSSGNAKSARRTKYFIPKQQQQQKPRNNIIYPSNPSNGHHCDRADQQPQRKFKGCILDDSSTEPRSRLHINLTGNKQNTSNQTKPALDSIIDASELPPILTYDKMIDKHAISDTIIPFLQRFQLDDAQSYYPLKGDCFVRQIGDFHYCALCCRRERINPNNTDAHLGDRRHIDLFLELRSRLFNSIPSIESVNMAALEYLTDTWLRESTLTDVQSEARIAAISDFCAALEAVDPVCHTRIIGSFYSGSSLASSDVNLELMHPNSKLFPHDPKMRDALHHKLVDPDAEYGSQINNHTLHYDLISNAVDTLHRFAMILVQGYSSIRTLTVKSSIDKLNRKAPTLVLLHEPTQVTLEITCNAEASHRLACLLKNYLSMDKRALELSILVKYWAKICNISDPHQGTLTPETFVILVIHFLQRVKPPILPCLHEMMEEQKKNGAEKSLDEQFQKLNLTDNKNCDDEDVATQDTENDLNYDEFTDQDFDPETIDNIEWKSKNTTPTHMLFIEFLQFSMREFAHNNRDVISIRSLKRIKAVDKTWNTEIKAIENPVRPSVNMAKNIGTPRTFEYIRRCFDHGFYYLTSMPMVSGLKRHIEPLDQPTDYIKLYLNMRKFDFYFGMKEPKIKQGGKACWVEMISQDLFARDVTVIKELIEYFIINKRNLESMPITVANNYDTRMLIPRDSQAAVFCWLCRATGHPRSKCDRRHALTLRSSDYDATIDSYVIFDHQFLELYVEDMIDKELADEHNTVVRELEKSICAWTGLECELRLFGSTVNLLGSFDSDLDICMTLSGNPTGQGVDCVKILGETVECLMQNKNVKKDSIEPVLGARVPIIKFKYKTFDIDLSMYNQCAIHNSLLLRSYVLLDIRVAQLVHLVKRYAKACCIADASKGSLSSYAWSLLVIHFLQHTSPPILPVLQETEDSQPKPVFGVNGWNVWFNDKPNKESMPQNDTNLTTLFKLFLIYYANFDFSQYIVSVRTSRLLTKFQKNWTNSMIAIEDPFELTYNLSGRLDDPMALYIRNSFAKTYKFMVSYQNHVKQYLRTPPVGVIRTLFRGQTIMGSEPPYRGCRICHKIGHKVKDCPVSRARKMPRLPAVDNKQEQSKNEQGASNVALI